MLLALKNTRLAPSVAGAGKGSPWGHRALMLLLVPDLGGTLGFWFITVQ